MKEATHYAFSIGLSFYLLSILHLSSGASLLLSLWLSVAVNLAIDALGHSSRDGHPTRSPVTHSIFTAPLWGGTIAWLSVFTFSELPGTDVASSETWLSIALGVMIAMGHLFLDSLTQAGVYSLRRRVALAHFNYDNPLLNAGFIAVGMLMLLVSLFGRGYFM